MSKNNETVAEVLAEMRFAHWADRIERALASPQRVIGYGEIVDGKLMSYSHTPNGASVTPLYTTPQLHPKSAEPTGCDHAAEAIAYHGAASPLECLSAAFAAMDQNDTELESWPQRAVDALACAGWAVVPCALPFAVLGEAGASGVFETGNPKHGWDFLVAKTRIRPDGVPAPPQPVTVTDSEVGGKAALRESQP